MGEVVHHTREAARLAPSRFAERAEALIGCASCTYAHAYAYVHMDTWIHAHGHTRMDTCTHAHGRMDTRTCTHAHAHMHTCTHAYMHMHTCTHGHMHTSLPGLGGRMPSAATGVPTTLTASSERVWWRRCSSRRAPGGQRRSLVSDLIVSYQFVSYLIVSYLIISYLIVSDRI